MRNVTMVAVALATVVVRLADDLPPIVVPTVMWYLRPPQAALGGGLSGAKPGVQGWRASGAGGL